MAMKLTIGILAITMIAGTAWAQSPKAVPAQAAKAAPGSPAPAVKPATVASAKSNPASGENNRLQRVHVVPGANEIKIEISARDAVKPLVYKMSSPSRVVVELPETVVATAQNKIPVDSAGVKGIRIGMDGKTPPTTSIVVDLEKAVPYEITAGASDKLVLTLHTSGDVAKDSAATTKPGPTAVQPSAAKTTPAPPKPTAAPAPIVAKNAPPTAKPQPAASSSAAAQKQGAEAKPAVAAKPAVTAKPVVAGKTEAPKAETTKIAAPKVAAETKAKAPAQNKPGADASKKADAGKPAKPEEKKWAMTGKRDPFFSPVVQQTGASGCSTGKKCLEINAINLRGIVKSENGFIAVVTNSLNKAYFLRESDPVFNGYVVKITGDSVVFQETLQDKLGKPFTREVVKRIFTPAV
jgi:Tfp pilus assembly protein PilP